MNIHSNKKSAVVQTMCHVIRLLKYIKGGYTGSSDAKIQKNNEAMQFKT